MTMSSVESQNWVMKHGPDTIHPNHHLNSALLKIMNSNITHLHLRKDKAVIETGQNNLASKSPTREFLIKKGQTLVDRSYDGCCVYKSVQLGPTKWISWYFDEGVTVHEQHPIFENIPKFE